MKRVAVLDPALENVNAGDEIISMSIKKIRGLEEGAVPRLTTHRLLKPHERRIVSAADLVILAGTNAISSRMERFRQWPVDPDLARRLRGKLLLLGVGWWQYQGPPNLYTRSLLRQLLTKDLPHAPRDNYTAERIRALGRSCFMTTCPTAWDLSGNTIPRLGMTGSVVVTITDYKKAFDTDRKWISRLTQLYKDIRVVGMGPGDEIYYRSLALPNTRWIGTGVDALDSALIDADMVGTRLHAGIRALELGRPALILSVDNRAQEIGRDTGILVASREDPDAITRIIDSRSETSLELPLDSIRSWNSAFSRYRDPDRG